MFIIFNILSSTALPVNFHYPSKRGWNCQMPSDLSCNLGLPALFPFVVLLHFIVFIPLKLASLYDVWSQGPGSMFYLAKFLLHSRKTIKILSELMKTILCLRYSNEWDISYSKRVSNLLICLQITVSKAHQNQIIIVILKSFPSLNFFLSCICCFVLLLFPDFSPRFVYYLLPLLFGSLKDLYFCCFQ